MKSKLSKKSTTRKSYTPQIRLSEIAAFTLS